MQKKNARLAEAKPSAPSCAILADLRDELPIRCGWQTIRESTLSETRLRARRYSIDGAHLSQGGA